MLIQFGDAVLQRIRAYAAASPFVITSVVVGNVQYPDEVANAVSRRLAAKAQKLMVGSPNHTVVYIPVGSMGVPPDWNVSGNGAQGTGSEVVHVSRCALRAGPIKDPIWRLSGLGRSELLVV